MTEPLIIRGRPLRSAAVALLAAEGLPVMDLTDVHLWIEDPQGVEWETFLTTGESTTYGTDVVKQQAAAACCTPNRAA